MPEAIITFTDSKVTPVQVTYPKNISHYVDLKHAMQDIKFFKCTPKFPEGFNLDIMQS